jgi:O-acetyl-ADP-ribose deacetylase (regulator of RNase III)
MDFNIIICSIDSQFTELLNAEFPPGNKYNISAFDGDFRDYPEKVDAIVSAGNSHGIMEGGIDLSISNFLDHYSTFIPKVQKQLKAKFNMKQQPGTACILDTYSDKCPYLIHVPTMNIPLRITEKSVLYWAFYNMIHEVYKHNQTGPVIKTILCCGLGTGAGSVQYDQFVQLSKLAYDHYLHNQELTSVDWDTANRQYVQLHKLLLSFPMAEEDMYQSILYKKMMIQY